MITDRDYLAKFIIATSEALGTTLNLGNDVDVNEIICDYFVKSVEVKLRSKN